MRIVKVQTAAYTLRRSHMLCVAKRGKKIRKNAQPVDEEGFIAIHLDKCKTEKFFYESKQRKFAALICS